MGVLETITTTFMFVSVIIATNLVEIVGLSLLFFIGWTLLKNTSETK